MLNSFGSKVRRLAFKHRTCNKEEWQAANLHFRNLNAASQKDE